MHVLIFFTKLIPLYKKVEEHKNGIIDPLESFEMFQKSTKGVYMNKFIFILIKYFLNK